MDACLMDGRILRAGAVAFVRNVKNPIKLARLVMERTPHVLLAGKGADEFAGEMKVELETDDYFFTDFRYQQLLKARDAHRVQLDHTPDEPVLIEEVLSSASEPLSHGLAEAATKDDARTANPKSKTNNPKPVGTVGAVACDFQGNLAAATSTGGMTNKKYGRIGDTPLVGAGTYADNKTCAVSCTGHGEFFMLTLAAYDVAALMKYKNLSLREAATEVVENLRVMGGEGGLIAVDARGNISLPFNSAGMYRGWITSDAAPIVEIYGHSN
jgi:beta-aspartyl-peptidase (threonine type)